MTTLLQALAAHNSWMSDAERALAEDYAQHLRAQLQQHGLPETATSALRIHAVVCALLLVGRAERALDEHGFAPEMGGVAKSAAAAIACIGRAQDHLRKACKEFDDYCRRESIARAKAAKQGSASLLAPPAPDSVENDITQKTVPDTQPRDLSRTAQSVIPAPSSRSSAAAPRLLPRVNATPQPATARHPAPTRHLDR